MLSKLAFAVAFAVVGAVSQPALAAHTADYMKYLAPFPAHKVAGNVYFVGSKGAFSCGRGQAKLHGEREH